MESIFNLRKDTLACRADSLPTGARPRKRSRSGIRPKIATSLTLNQARGNKTVLRSARHDLSFDLQTPVARSDLHLVLSQPCIVIAAIFPRTRSFSTTLPPSTDTLDSHIRCPLLSPNLLAYQFCTYSPFLSLTIPSLLFSPSLSLRSSWSQLETPSAESFSSPAARLTARRSLSALHNNCIWT
jgi:hypothetical protein